MHNVPMKRLLMILPVVLILTATACSSSSKPSTGGSGNQSRTIGTGKTAEAAPVCAAVHEFGTEAPQPGDTPAKFPTIADHIHATATKLRTNPPVSVATGAKAYAAAMDIAANKVATASSTAAADTDLAPLLTPNTNAGIAAFAAWVRSNC